MPTDLARSDGPAPLSAPPARPLALNKQYHLALAVFWLTAAASVVTAYDPANALRKLGVLTAAVLVFYGVAGQGGKYIRLTTLSFIGLGAALSLVFLFQHDWQAQPADLAAVNRLGRAWMAVRPDAWTAPTAPNRVAGLLAALLPLAVWVWGWQPSGRTTPPGGSPAEDPDKPALWPRGLAAAGGLVMAVGLVMTSSRAAWLALAAGVLVWWISRVEARWSASEHGWYRRQRHNVQWAVGVVLLVGCLAAFVGFEALVDQVDRTLPGAESGRSRQRIILDSLRLTEDFQFLGGGLGAFPGLYSEYMRAIPYYTFGYSHNLYLDVSIEQGMPGLLALLVVLTTSVSICLGAAKRRAGPDGGRLAQAVLVALVALLVHGLVDDAFYGEGGTPLLFLLPALAVVAAGGWDHGARRVGPPPSRLDRLWKIFLPVAGVLLIVAGHGFRRTYAEVQANVGAVLLARAQLADFPSGEWRTETGGAALDAAEIWLRRAATTDPENRTANQRLGLIAGQRGDFESAAHYLAAAHAADPEHFGVMKNLAYTYVWLGRFDQALPLLAQIPEARQELEAYWGWWPHQARPDLAENARAVLRMELIP